VVAQQKVSISAGAPGERQIRLGCDG
jgi:hypothetical protein